MASELIIYKNHGFWVTDAYYQLWMGTLCHVIDLENKKPDWLADAKTKWEEMVQLASIILYADELDEIITSKEKARTIINLSKKSLIFLKKFKKDYKEEGDEIFGLKDINFSMPQKYKEEKSYNEYILPVDLVYAVGSAFIGLLKGKFTVPLDNSPFINRYRWIEFEYLRGQIAPLPSGKNGRKDWREWLKKQNQK